MELFFTHPTNELTRESKAWDNAVDMRSFVAEGLARLFTKAVVAIGQGNKVFYRFRSCCSKETENNLFFLYFPIHFNGEVNAMGNFGKRSVETEIVREKQAT